MPRHPISTPAAFRCEYEYWRTYRINITSWLPRRIHRAKSFRQRRVLADNVRRDCSADIAGLNMVGRYRIPSTP